MVLYILLKQSFSKLAETELTTPAPLYHKFFVGLLGLWHQSNPIKRVAGSGFVIISANISCMEHQGTFSIPSLIH